MVKHGQSENLAEGYLLILCVMFGIFPKSEIVKS